MVTGKYEGCITLLATNYEKNKWTKLKEMNGYNKRINSLCELSGNRLLSGSDDYALKVWNINNDTLTNIKKLQGHKYGVHQIILLTKDIIVSGSADATIRIWDINVYKEIQTLKEDFVVYIL